MTAPDRDAFRVPDARRAGLPRRWVDDPQFDRPFFGVRAPRAEHQNEDTFFAARERVLRAVMHWTVHMHATEYFCLATAALIWGLPLPPALALQAGLHIGSPGRATRVRGATGHQFRPSLVSVVDHPDHGVRVTDPATTWAMLAASLSHLYDVVAVGDAIVRTPRIPGPHGRIERPALASLVELEKAAHAGRRVGVAQLREAITLIRPGAASRPETWTRLTLVDAGLPEPVLDFDVYDDRGSFIGCVDLAYPEHRIAIEYEGDQHRTDPAQWQRDIEKHERLADLGWRVVRVPRDQLFAQPGALVQRVRRVLHAARR